MLIIKNENATRDELISHGWHFWHAALGAAAWFRIEALRNCSSSESALPAQLKFCRCFDTSFVSRMAVVGFNGECFLAASFVTFLVAFGAAFLVAFEVTFGATFFVTFFVTFLAACWLVLLAAFCMVFRVTFLVVFWMPFRCFLSRKLIWWSTWVPV